MKEDLAKEHCVPCENKITPLTGAALDPYKKEIPEWRIVDDHHITRTFTFPDFASALSFVNKIGDIAEDESHHPDIALSWGKVTVSLFTHNIGGLSTNDFIMAGKIDLILTDKH